MRAVRYLIDTETKEIYAWSEAFAGQAKFENYHGPLPKIGSDGLRRAIEGCEFEDEGFVGKPSDPRTDERAAENRLDKLVAAMMNMSNLDFATSSGIPKANVLERVVGFETTKEEREKAFGRFKAAQAQKFVKPEDQPKEETK